MATEEEVLQDSRIKQEIDISDDPVFAEIDKKDIIDISNVKFEQKELLVKLVRMDSSFKERMKRTCPICSKQLSSPQSFYGHLVSKHSDVPNIEDMVPIKIHTCIVCHYKSIDSSHFSQHLRKHFKEFECHDCGFRTRDKKELKEHVVASHVPDTRYRCPRCKRYYKSQVSYNDHLLNRTDCKTKKERKRNHQILQCAMCPYRSSGKDRLRRHIISAHSAKSCKICNMQFTAKRHFDGHIQKYHAKDGDLMALVTSGNYLRYCDQCDYETFNKIDLETHELVVHKGEASLDCTVCRKTFKTKLYKDNHVFMHHDNNDEMMKTITSEIHQCDRCSFRCVPVATLRRHMAMKHN